MPRGGSRANSGPKKGSHQRPAIEKEAFRKCLLAAVMKQKEALVEALINQALKGDVPALREVFDRGLGKVAQEITGEDGNPIKFIIERYAGDQDQVAPSAR